MRLDSCRSVPNTYRPPAATTSSCSFATAFFAASKTRAHSLSYVSGSATGSRPFSVISSIALNSGFPPSMMSVPRPAMFVATVTTPLRPASAMIAASRACCLALRTEWGMPTRSVPWRGTPTSPTETVPTRTGWPAGGASPMSATIASNFAAAFLYRKSDWSIRIIGR